MYQIRITCIAGRAAEVCLPVRTWGVCEDLGLGWTVLMPHSPYSGRIPPPRPAWRSSCRSRVEGSRNKLVVLPQIFSTIKSYLNLLPRCHGIIKLAGQY